MIVVALALWGGWRLTHGLARVDADFLSLIGREDPDMRGEDQRPIDAVRHLLAQDGRRAVFMVSAPDRATALDTARALTTALSALSGTAAVTGPDSRAQRQKAVTALLAPIEGTVLAEADRADLQAGRGEAVARRGLAALVGPMPPPSGDSLRRDPFSLHGRYLLDLGARLSGAPDLVVKEGRTHVPVLATLAPDLRATGGDDAWVTGARATMDRLSQATEISIQATGPVFFAQAEGARARADVQRIALVTGLGLLALVVLVFASWVPILATLLTVGAGLAAGLAVVTTLFPAIHAIALVFGASLIGVSVDYAFHYLAQDPRSGPPAVRLGRVRAGLLLGLATSILGFLALAVSPLALLGQIAAYSIGGLASAMVTVFLVLPLLPDPKARGPLPLERGMAALIAAQTRLRPGLPGRLALLGAILAGFALFGLLARGEDSIRGLGAPKPALLAEAQAITRTLGLGGVPLFVTLTGPDRETLLQRSEATRAALTPLIEKGVLAGLVAPSDLVPSQARQTADRALITKALLAPHGALLAPLLGADVAASADPEARPLLLPDGATRAVLPELDDLLEDTRGVIRLRGAESAAIPALTQALEAVAGARLVDPQGTISAQFADYRRGATWALGLTMALAALLAVWRHGPIEGPLTMAAPAGAVLCALVGGQLLGIPLSFFTTMALFLVFAIGADYALFLAESRDPAERRDTTLAVLLSLISSLLAFGLLATSSVALVGSIGATIALGLAAAWLLAPLLSSQPPSQS